MKRKCLSLSTAALKGPYHHYKDFRLSELFYSYANLGITYISQEPCHLILENVNDLQQVWWHRGKTLTTKSILDTRRFNNHKVGIQCSLQKSGVHMSTVIANNEASIFVKTCSS